METNGTSSPAANSENQNNQSPQDTNGDKGLLSGKYKSEEERDKAYLEAQKTMQEALERAKHAEEMLEAYILSSTPSASQSNSNNNAGVNSAGGTGTPVSDYSSLLTDPNGTLAKIKEDAKKEALAEVQRYQSVVELQRQTRDKFYRDYPDLIDSDVIVGHFAAEVTANNPRMPLEMAMKEVAQKARQYIGKLREKGGEGAAAVGGGTGGTRNEIPGSSDSKPKQLTPEEVLLAEVKARNSQRNSKIGF